MTKILTEDPTVYMLSALAAASLLFITFSFSRIFRASKEHQASFFFLLSIGWAVNLLYIMFEEAARRVGADTLLVQLVVRLMNTVSYLFFLMAARWKLQDLVSLKALDRAIFLASLITLGLPLAAIPRPDLRSIWNLPSIALGIFAILAVAWAYQRHFHTTPQVFGSFTRFSLTWSMYLYATLQLGIFALPPYVDQAPEHLKKFLFGLGIILKILHIGGLSLYGEAVMARYNRRMALVDRAKMSAILADQLSHELMTPAAELKIRLAELAGPEDDEGDTSVAIPRSQFRKLLGILEEVGGLLEIFQRFQNDQRVDRAPSVRNEKCNLNILCDEVLISIKLTLQPRFKIKKDYNAGPVVLGVDSEIMQIIRNLVKNALEAMEQVDLPSKMLPPIVVRTAVDREMNKVNLAIVNDGAGLPAEHGERIFEDGITTKPGDGRGHGLFIVKNLVEKHGGEVRAYDEAMKSGLKRTTFEVTLPLAVPR